VRAEREALMCAVAGRAEQDNLHAIRSAFDTFTTRPESAIRRQESLSSSHAL
jgi:hypothetical protein